LGKVPKYLITTEPEATKIRLLKYLRDASLGVERVFKMKLMLVGKGDVGKTTLLRNLTQDKTGRAAHLRMDSQAPPSPGQGQGQGQGQNVSTDGIEIAQWDLPVPGQPEPLTFSCWDMGGQEVYYSTHQFFLSERSLYLIVFNLVDESSIKKVDYWLASIQIRAPDAPIFLVGTHMDDKMCTAAHIDSLLGGLAKLKGTYPKIDYITAVSCKPGEESNIDELRQEIISVAMKQRHMGMEVPKMYLALEEKVVARRALGASTMSWKEFQTMAMMECGLAAGDVPEVAEYLHSLGVIIYFGDRDSGLADIVITDPEFLTKLMATIVTTKANFVQDGVLQHSALPQIWREPTYPATIHPLLLTLLQKFEICFNLGRDSSLFPVLLPHERPDFELLWPPLERYLAEETNVQFDRIYQFDFVPPGLVSRLIVRLLHSSEGKRYWRNGALVEQPNRNHALVEFFPTLKQLSIKVRGKVALKPADLLRTITETFETLLTSWYNINRFGKSVPCRHCLLNRLEQPTVFSYEELEDMAAREQWMVHCQNGGQLALDILVPDLAMADFDGHRIEFNDVQIEKELATGGFGVIYKGLWNKKVVAVKKLKEERLQDFTKAYDNFRREVWLMSSLKHPNIVCLEAYTVKPFSMIMEFLPCGDLYAFLHDQAKPLDWPLRYKIAIDVAAGMKFLHGITPPLLHRDLKTPNILLAGFSLRDAPNLAKVADFGLSSRLFVDALKEQTQKRAVANPTWLAPEIMGEAEYSEKSDVYGYGIILWEIATRVHPFEEFQFKYMKLLEESVLAGVRPTIPPTCPPPFAALVKACWAQEAERRPTFGTVCEALVRIVERECPPGLVPLPKINTNKPAPPDKPAALQNTVTLEVPELPLTPRAVPSRTSPPKTSCSASRRWGTSSGAVWRTAQSQSGTRRAAMCSSPSPHIRTRSMPLHTLRRHRRRGPALRTGRWPSGARSRRRQRCRASRCRRV
jgi:leucine-rich repeat kinase 2